MKGYCKKTLLPDGARVMILMTRETVRRLSLIHFRGQHKPLAGNFLQWNDLQKMMRDDLVRDALLADMLRAIETNDDRPEGKQQRLQIIHEHDVGWSATTACIDEEEVENGWWCPDDEHPDPRLVEPFKPNKRSNALRVRNERRDILAPLTQWLTIVYSLRFDAKFGWIAVIHTMYPGEDIGELKGDITYMQGVVFFDFDHPGQPLHCAV